MLSLVLSLTLLLGILAHSFHSPVKTALLFLTGQCAMRAAYQAGDNRKEVEAMPDYNVFRKYKITADNPTQALRKLLDALDAKKDEDYHVSDSVREADEQPGNGQLTAWATNAKKQLFGK